MPCHIQAGGLGGEGGGLAVNRGAGGLKLAETEVGDGEEERSAAGGGLEGEGVIEGGDGLRKTAELREGQAQVQIGLGKARCLLHNLLERRDGAAGLPGAKGLGAPLKGLGRGRRKSRGSGGVLALGDERCGKKEKREERSHAIAVHGRRPGDEEVVVPSTVRQPRPALAVPAGVDACSIRRCSGG